MSRDGIILRKNKVEESEHRRNCIIVHGVGDSESIKPMERRDADISHMFDILRIWGRRWLLKKHFGWGRRFPGMRNLQRALIIGQGR